MQKDLLAFTVCVGLGGKSRCASRSVGNVKQRNVDKCKTCQEWQECHSSFQCTNHDCFFFLLVPNSFCLRSVMPCKLEDMTLHCGSSNRHFDFVTSTDTIVNVHES